MQEITDTRGLDGPTKPKTRTPQLIYLTAVVFFSVDRYLKALAIAGLTMGAAPLEFDLFKNKGIAFSIPMHDAIFWPLAVLILTALTVLFFRFKKKDDVSASLLFLIIIGSISNIIDRMLIDATIDYMILFDRSAINIADVMILAGVIALFAVTRKTGKDKVVPS